MSSITHNIANNDPTPRPEDHTFERPPLGQIRGIPFGFNTIGSKCKIESLVITLVLVRRRCAQRPDAAAAARITVFQPPAPLGEIRRARV